jgi:PDZ domain-containing secreted protein
MAASAWRVYNEAKKYIMNGTIDLDTSALRMALHKSTSNASTYTLSTYASINNVVDAAGYTGVKTLTCSVKDSTSAGIFDVADVIFTASGANVTSIAYAVIYVSNGKALCWSKLSTSVPFTVTSGNTLTIQINASGVFRIGGGTT